MSDQAEEIRRLWAVLYEAYHYFAPRYTGGRRVPARRLARMTAQDIDARWEYGDRHFAHRLAQTLYPPKPAP